MQRQPLKSLIKITVFALSALTLSVQPFSAYRAAGLGADNNGHSPYLIYSDDISVFSNSSSPEDAWILISLNESSIVINQVLVSAQTAPSRKYAALVTYSEERDGRRVYSLWYVNQESQKAALIGQSAENIAYGLAYAGNAFVYVINREIFRYSHITGKTEIFAGAGGLDIADMAVSPDGNTVCCSDNDNLYVIRRGKNPETTVNRTGAAISPLAVSDNAELIYYYEISAVERERTQSIYAYKDYETRYLAERRDVNDPSRAGGDWLIQCLFNADSTQAVIYNQLFVNGEPAPEYGDCWRNPVLPRWVQTMERGGSLFYGVTDFRGIMNPLLFARGDRDHIIRARISQDGKKLFFLTDDRRLSLIDGLAPDEDAEIIAADCEDFFISDSGGHIYIFNTRHELYTFDESGRPILIAEDALRWGIEPAAGTVCYVADLNVTNGDILTFTGNLYAGSGKQTRRLDSGGNVIQTEAAPRNIYFFTLLSNDSTGGFDIYKAPLSLDKTELILRVSGGVFHEYALHKSPVFIYADPADTLHSQGGAGIFY
jgi:hypothetical protein